MSILRLGDREHVVLRAVAGLGSCSVREVFEVVGEPHGLAYTTIATVLDRLFAKELVTRQLDGKAFRYRVTRKAAAIERGRTRSFIERLLGDDPTPAVAHLVDAVESVDPELLDVLAAEVARRRAKRGS